MGMASLTSEFSLQCMPGPVLVPDFNKYAPRKSAGNKKVYYDESDPSVVSAIDKHELEYDPEKAVMAVLPSKRQALEFQKGISKSQALFGQRQFGQDAALMKARHAQDLSSLEQIEQDRLDPDCCKNLPRGYMDFRLSLGRGKSERLRASSPPRQNAELMGRRTALRDLLPGEGRLNNIEELSVMSAQVKKQRRTRKYVAMGPNDWPRV